MNLCRPWGWRSIFEKSFKNHLKSLNKSIFLLRTQCNFSIDVSWDSSIFHPGKEDVQFLETGQRAGCFVQFCLNVYILRFESGARAWAWGGRGESDPGDSLLKTKAGKLATGAWTLTWLGERQSQREQGGGMEIICNYFCKDHQTPSSHQIKDSYSCVWSCC